MIQKNGDEHKRNMLINKQIFIDMKFNAKNFTPDN